MKNVLKLLDIVALLTDMPTANLQVGQVGTIVEELADGVYEIEFADSQGRTIVTCAVDSRQLLKLTHECAH